MLEGSTGRSRRSSPAPRSTARPSASAARTAIHAEPTTFGLKLAGWAFELDRDRARLARALEGLRVGKLSGAVGTYAATDPEVERIACERLGLEPDPISTQVVPRDRHAELLTALALARLLARPLRDRDPAPRPHRGARGRGAVRHAGRRARRRCRTSATRSSPSASAGSRASCARTRVVGLENVALWHERDISHSSAERDRAPRLVPRARLHARPLRLARRRARRAPGADAREPRREPRALLLPAAAARARRGRARPRRGVPDRPAARDARLGRGAATSARSRAPTPRSPGGSTSTPSSTSAPTPRHVDAVFERLRALVRGGGRPCLTPPSTRQRQGPRALRARRRAAAARRERPDLDVRRRPADRDPRQGPRAHRALGVLVRADAGARPEPPARAARRRPLDRVPAARDAADRVRRPRLPRRLRLEGLPARPARSAATRCRRARESDRLPEPIFTPATKAQTGHDENIDARQAAALVGEEPFAEVERIALALYRFAAEHAAARGIMLADTKFEFGLDARRRARARRRGAHARLVPLLAGRRVRARRPAAVVRQAVRPRLLRDARLGQDRPRARSCPTTSSPARGRATSRRSSG